MKAGEDHGIDAWQVNFADGTVRPKGFYWREWIGPGHFGSEHGPFDTKDEADRDAVQNIR